MEFLVFGCSSTSCLLLREALNSFSSLVRVKLDQQVQDRFHLHSYHLKSLRTSSICGCWLLDQWDCNKISCFSRLLGTNLDLCKEIVSIYHTVTLPGLMDWSSILTHTHFYVLIVYIDLRHYRLCLHLMLFQDTLFLVFLTWSTINVCDVNHCAMSKWPCQKNDTQS